jgi:hypothetical protein
MNADLVAQIAEFCSRLRRHHGFTIGPREMEEAVRAVEIVGICERARVAAALRAVCCSRAEELELFDRAFAAFFSPQSAGVEQPRHPPGRRSRPGSTKGREDQDGAVAEQTSFAGPADDSETTGSAVVTRAESTSAAEAWQMRRARYSPAAAEASELTISAEGYRAAIADAQRLLKRLRIVRSRRWLPQHNGSRFDLRKTLHASLRTGGNIIEAHLRGHPPRSPGFFVLLDGSRSMSEYAPHMMQFTRALCNRTRRAKAFLFSTKLREITDELRKAGASQAFRLDGLGEAWGGGTRIGGSLAECVRRHSGQLNDRAFFIVISDGLDVGEVAVLQRALRQIARRCAGVVWLNPHAGQPGYAPSAGGMRAALPYVKLVGSLDELAAHA